VYPTLSLTLSTIVNIQGITPFQGFGGFLLCCTRPWQAGLIMTPLWGYEVIKGRLRELQKWKFINRLPEKENAVTD